MTRMLRLALLAFAHVLAAPAWADDYEDGFAAYERGDYVEALWLWRPYAEQGNAFAQFNLGLMYGKGEGVPQNDAEAAKWYRKAADQGLTTAQNNLGNMYYNGHGVPQNDAEAVKWYRKAADQGLTTAQNHLGNMYYNGDGVPQDYVQAHMWLNLAAAQGDEDAAKYRDTVAARMTPAQLARAQELARNWRPRTEQTALPSAEQYLADIERTRQVAQVQAHLSALGYDPGPADGVLGAKTRAAIRAYQADVGLAVDGRVSEALVASLRTALALSGAAPPQPEKPAAELVGTGSGFIVNGSSDVLTNQHVVAGCAEVRVRQAGREGERAPVTVADDENDLALIRIPADAPSFARFREGRGARPGDGVVAIGFPLHGLLASGPNVTVGTVSALAGIRDDIRYLQVSAPVQPGNSGGPLLDMSGNVVGIVVGKLDALGVAAVIGDIPQNVNFAVKDSVARSFLDAHGIEYETAASERQVSAADVGERATKFTVLVECWK